jgi:nicotinamide mononucleotide transporter
MPSNLLDQPFIGFTNLITTIEWLSAAIGLLSVIGNLKLKRWAWLAQAASGSGYGVVFFHQKLFGLTLLQIYFVAVALCAWWLWSAATTENAAKIRYLSARQIGLTLTCWGIATMAIGALLTKAGEGNSAYIDAFTTAGSVIAQWLMLRYFQQTWHVWFIVNMVSVVLFFYSNLLPTSFLYCVFTGLAVVGAKSWHKQSKTT